MLISVSALCKWTAVPLNSIKADTGKYSSNLIYWTIHTSKQTNTGGPNKGSEDAKRLCEDAALPKRIIIRRCETPESERIPKTPGEM